MRALHLLVALLALTPALLPVVAGGQDAQSVSQVTPALKEMEGNTCPVMGGAIDKKYSYVYKGTIYYFCCPACIPKFKENPEKYIGKMTAK